MDAVQVAAQMTNFVNTFSLSRNDEFNEAMSKEHRTLQQSFTRLCIGWLEHVASDNYRTDGRNEASKEFAKLFVKLMREHRHTDGMEIHDSIPLSKHLPMI